MAESSQSPEVFATTCWTVILSARDGAMERANEAMARLCRTYWPPLFAFLRRQGYAPADAEDLVQGFFERFLGGSFLRDVQRDKGRFRSFLLASLRHHVANVRRDQRTQRRGGQATHLTLDEPGALERCEAVLHTEAPDEVVFDRVWAETIMHNAAQRLRTEYVGSGRGELFEVLRVWLAAEARPGEYARVAPDLGLSEGALAAAVFRLRQRYRQLVREEVAHTVQSPAEIDEEVRHLLAVLLAA